MATTVQYDSLESLTTALTDLEARKNGVAKQANLIIESNQLSKKGLGRVMRALNDYPRVKTKLTDPDEAALLTLSVEVKNHQLSMMILVDAINTLQKQQEANNKGEQNEL